MGENPPVFVERRRHKLTGRASPAVPEGGDSTFALSNAGHIAGLVNPWGNPKATYFTAPTEPDESPEEGWPSPVRVWTGSRKPRRWRSALRSAPGRAGVARRLGPRATCGHAFDNEQAAMRYPHACERFSGVSDERPAPRPRCAAGTGGSRADRRTTRPACRSPRRQCPSVHPAAQWCAQRRRPTHGRR